MPCSEQIDKRRLLASVRMHLPIHVPRSIVWKEAVAQWNLPAGRGQVSASRRTWQVFGDNDNGVSSEHGVLPKNRQFLDGLFPALAGDSICPRILEQEPG